MIYQRIVHYLKVYQGFLNVCFAEAMSFRLHFFLLIVMDLAFYTSTLASIDIIYDHVSMIGPWNREQLLFFVSIMLAINQFHMTFVSENFWYFSLILRQGDLDFILLKPISSLFSTFFRRIRAGSFPNVIVTWSVVIYFGNQVQLDWTGWILLVPLVLMGFILAAGIEIVIACSMFWMLEGSGVNFLRLELQQLARWPDFIYGSVARRVLTVIVPVLLVGNPPVRFLIDYGDYLPLIAMGLAIILVWSILGVVWRIGLNAYESASS